LTPQKSETPSNLKNNKNQCSMKMQRHKSQTELTKLGRILPERQNSVSRENIRYLVAQATTKPIETTQLLFY
jgi:hypothetical protein